MKFKALASSSTGNAYIVSDNDTRILLECGVSHKKLQKLSGFSLSEFQACLVSHEHKDHAKSVQELIERGMEVYKSQAEYDGFYHKKEYTLYTALGVEIASIVNCLNPVLWRWSITVWAIGTSIRHLPA